jgi:hypothetical protein
MRLVDNEPEWFHKMCCYQCQFCKRWAMKEDWGPGRITCPHCKKIQLSPAEIEENDKSKTR